MLLRTISENKKEKKKDNLCGIESAHYSAELGPLINIMNILGTKTFIMSWLYCHISNVEPVPRRYCQTGSFYDTEFGCLKLVYNSCTEAALVNSLPLGNTHTVYLNKRVSDFNL